MLSSRPLRQCFAHTSCSIIELGQGLVNHLARWAKTIQPIGFLRLSLVFLLLQAALR